MYCTTVLITVLPTVLYIPSPCCLWFNSYYSAGHGPWSVVGQWLVVVTVARHLGKRPQKWGWLVICTLIPSLQHTANRYRYSFLPATSTYSNVAPAMGSIDMIGSSGDQMHATTTSLQQPL